MKRCDECGVTVRSVINVAELGMCADCAIGESDTIDWSWSLVDIEEVDDVFEEQATMWE